LRNHFYDNTLPWKDNGDRLLTRKTFQRFIQEHEKLISEFNNEVQKFIDVNYCAAREKAAFRMGELFNPRDYPAADELRYKFSANLDVDAVTTANDFRVQMSGPEQDRIRADIEAKTAERLGKAMQSVWTRLADTLGHFAERMTSDGALYESTIKNLEEIVEILPELNVLNDSNLDKIRDEIKATIVGYDIKDLRKHPEVRSIAASEAKRIMDDMRGFMTAFGA
jgi:BioD-like phosphotransacetylase family protein